jgi:hypothetical protein
MTAPVSFREKVRFFSLAPRAPSIHDPKRALADQFCCAAQRSGATTSTGTERATVIAPDDVKHVRLRVTKRYEMFSLDGMFSLGLTPA